MNKLAEEEVINKSEDLNSFVWKGSKSLDETGKYKQSEKKLVDMTEKELKDCYSHCKTMLFNKDVQNPGRYIVLDIISDQKERCGAELFLRYVDTAKGWTRFALLTAINEFLNNNKDVFKNYKPLVNDAFNVPSEFEKIPISLVIDGCLDRLGTFNKKHITRTFILKQGIWLAPNEVKDLTEEDQDGNLRNRLDVIRERLNIKDIEKLSINSKGLNYTQMRSMLNVKSNKKYMDLTTSQLETLRYRILFNLEESVKSHINSWERRMEEIEKVVEYKGFKL